MLGLASGGCEQSKEYVLPHTLSIFPHEAGKYRILLVRDTTFTTAGKQGQNYYKRELLAGEEQDLRGRSLRLIEVYRSPAELGSAYDFSLDRVWSQFFQPQESGTYYAERTEENQRYLLLKFPVSEVQRWNRNAFNSQGEQELRYGNVDTTVTVNGKTFEHCVYVIQKDDTLGFINKAFAYEIYAPEVGLIKKYDNTQVFDGPRGEFNPDKSRIYLEEIVEHN
jgi:hypothetical protein